jgi:hypothetical protein
MIRAMYSPSKLWLVITRKPHPRKSQAQGKTQRCQKEKTLAFMPGVVGAPSSNETAKRIVGPMIRIAR